MAFIAEEFSLQTFEILSNSEKGLFIVNNYFNVIHIVSMHHNIDEQAVHDSVLNKQGPINFYPLK